MITKQLVSFIPQADGSVCTRINVENDSRPDDCPKCHRELDSHGGMVGEEVLVCAVHGIVWEDQVDAIGRCL